MTLKDEKPLLKVVSYEFRDSPDFVTQGSSITINVRKSACIKRKKTLAKTNLTEENAIYLYLNLLDQR